jgi:hypothetical protein
VARRLRERTACAVRSECFCGTRWTRSTKPLSDSRPHPENGLPSTYGDRCRRGTSIQSLRTGTCSRIDACRIECDATPDVCADAVSGPSSKLRGELPNSDAGNHLCGGWNARGSGFGRTSGRWNAPDRYCSDHQQAKAGIRHRSDSSTAAGMRHARMDTETAGAQGKYGGETLSEAWLRSCGRRFLGRPDAALGVSSLSPRKPTPLPLRQPPRARRCSTRLPSR